MFVNWFLVSCMNFIWLFSVLNFTFYTSLNDYGLSQSHLHEKWKTSVPVISQNFKSIWWQFIWCLNMLVWWCVFQFYFAWLTFEGDHLRWFCVQKKLLLAWSCVWKLVNGYCVKCRMIMTKSKFCASITVWTTLTLIQGHRGIRKWKLLLSFSCKVCQSGQNWVWSCD